MRVLSQSRHLYSLRLLLLYYLDIIYGWLFYILSQEYTQRKILSMLSSATDQLILQLSGLCHLPLLLQLHSSVPAKQSHSVKIWFPSEFLFSQTSTCVALYWLRYSSVWQFPKFFTALYRLLELWFYSVFFLEYLQ